jgi:DNA-binding PadR family transcriptional regulator
MADVATSETDQISKTELILSHIAEQGPKTEYDLYKQFPKLSHGTIHFCLNKLTHDGLITYSESQSRKGQRRKQYHLTFIGTVSYVGSFLHWLDEELTDDQLAERWKHFDKEEQGEIIEFLSKQGKLLKYGIFEESEWLAQHYQGITRVFVVLAEFICRNPPRPYKNLFLVAVAQNARDHSVSIGGKGVEENLPSSEELMSREQDAFREEFTRLFFELIVFMKHDDKPTANLKLRRLAEEELEEKRQETGRVELAIHLFGGKIRKLKS